MNVNDLHQALTAALRQDRWTGRERSISVSVSLDSGRVVLSGSCETIAAKRRAVALTQVLAARFEIADELRRAHVRPRGDDELTRALGDRFAAEPVFEEHALSIERHGVDEVLRRERDGRRRVSIRAVEGAVTLAGEVASPSHRRFAEVLAWWTEGCAFVSNRLNVSPPREDSDDELNDTVRLVLDSDPFVDSGQLHCGTAAGIVQIEGLLIDASQRERVIEDVWLVPGVWDVNDQIQTLA